MIAARLLSALILGLPVAAAQSQEAPSSLYSYNEVSVQRGDTAYSLAREFGLSVPELLSLNGLSSHDLEVGQVLRVQARAPHQVVKGDTLYSLARQFGLTVEALQAANGLSDAGQIELGQWLAIPSAPQSRPMPQSVLATQPTPASTPAADTVPAVEAAVSAAFAAAAPAAQAAQSSLAGGLDSAAEALGWRRNALALLNTPYVYGGNSATGVDCSAFVLRVFQPLGISLPRTSAQQALVGQPVARASLRGGDLVFFDTVGRGSVTHVGVYLGQDQFVNANSYYGRVVVDKLDGDRYWSPRYLSARRILDPGTVAKLNSGLQVAMQPGRAD
ncbi:peptidoglycan endopeptidase [Deinococcus radiophilus]|uniref:Peptidoglycan endopeptidase n=1 Tax=Deinococcus radiophilus TaxID=32062 RepID=A0A3S0KFP7_9DEIO|nr:peptidoglycan endopeptidase [Deinococcus radiophilus]